MDKNDSFDPDGDDDIDELKNEDDEGKVKRLLVKRDDILTQLTAIDEILKVSGYLEDDPISTSIVPQTGITIGGKLSYRGIEKAIEYFSYVLDSDDDGYITYGDFRGKSKVFQ